jgi:murein DD-endopeptidase MepM/ murein hydrolase activator NlpD
MLGVKILKLLAVLVAAFAVVALLFVTLRVGASPTLELRTSSPAIGGHTEALVTARAPGRGLAGLRVEVEQGGAVHVVLSRSYTPSPAWNVLAKGTETDEVRAEVGRDAVADLREGEAVVRAVAERAPTWLRHPDPVVEELRLPVRLVPPSLSVLSSQHYVAQGGSGVVVYRAGPTAVRHGVRAGGHFFPGAPLPGSAEGDQFALFGVPFDLGDERELRLVAEDDAGNTAESAFVDRFFPRPPPSDRIRVDDDFMGRVVPAIRSATPGLADRGSLLENYLEINRDLRRANAEELLKLAPRSTPHFLWHQAFLPLPGGKVMSSFADQRTYLYEGRVVDHQTHLGFDLAAVAHTPVPAANHGIVLLARYFGIYGNTVVLDHGFGLMSLYAHLSSIDVVEGQEVERGAVIGRTGSTGLAGGDHLHFTMLVGGVPVDPREWWDGHWIRDRVAAKLGPALDFQADGGR